ncbi:TetR/AcrR family transcriptional regulator [Sphingomonas sp.]|jgi:AcrR family transcriptional regulator|uniref:TetR/AcrR family transcriptional regulator n=1 Tax=Sphingomonas sp. TaxID=28214 RepID=UPI00260DEC72|nr:TetR/AcrR family transcriptional regulator [Sphingomonas sp.]MDF2494594.1 TetR/AcrR family transcriptional regulator [Sphingomonas sp.]
MAYVHAVTRSAAPAHDRTARFAQRRSQILDTASAQINRHGARGMTLTAVAKALGLDTSSVTYYFKRKDHLAAACYERTLNWALETAREAARQPTAAERVRHLIAAQFDLYRRSRNGEVGDFAVLSDIRALDETTREPLEAAYLESFAVIRGFFAPEGARASGSRSAIAATHLTASLQWLPAWIDRYQTRDFDRVQERLYDVLANGLARSNSPWPVTVAPPPQDASDGTQGRFLAAATRLINRHGYVGASVERIAAELGVSTGSFYHHLDNKDDLVLTCFQRSFSTIEAAQTHGDATGRDEGERLAIALANLVGLQFTDDSPLLRMSAYQALPLELRADMLALAGQVTRHVAGTIADGIADGSLRPVDPLVASQTVMAAVSAASDMHRWAQGRDPSDAVRAYLEPLRVGIFH